MSFDAISLDAVCFSHRSKKHGAESGEFKGMAGMPHGGKKDPKRQAVAGAAATYQRRLDRLGDIFSGQRDGGVY